MVTALMIKPGEHPIITMLCDTAEYLNHAVSLGSDEICLPKPDGSITVSQFFMPTAAHRLDSLRTAKSTVSSSRAHSTLSA